MNVWMNIAIPLIATVVVLAIGLAWALRTMYWWKDVAKDNARIADERSKDIKEVTEAFNEAAIARDKFKLQLDEALKPKTRTSRAKPKEVP